jgi:hypothetical protein
MTDCALVLIEWLDSRQPSPSWQRLDRYEPSDACVCASVGWLIHDGAEIKALAPNTADIEDDSVQASGIIHIPTPAVRRIVRLAEEA